MSQNKLDQNQFSPYDFGQNNNQEMGGQPHQYRQDPSSYIAQDSPYAALMGAGGNIMPQQQQMPPPQMQRPPQTIPQPPVQMPQQQHQPPPVQQMQNQMPQQPQATVSPLQQEQQVMQLNHQNQQQPQMIPPLQQQKLQMQQPQQMQPQYQAPGGIVQQYQQPNLMTSYKTADERQKTKRKIIEKYLDRILQTDEKEKYKSYKFKIDCFSMLGNGVLFMSIYKLVTMQRGQQKTQQLIRLLLLQMMCVSGEFYYNRPRVELINDCSNRYLNHLNDKQLDTYLETGSPHEMLMQNYNASQFAQQQHQMAHAPQQMQQQAPMMANQQQPQYQQQNPYQQQYQMQYQQPGPQQIDPNTAQIVEQLEMRQGANMPIKE